MSFDFRTTPPPPPSPLPLCAIFRDTEDGISLYKTGTYHLHHLEVPTGYHFVLVTNTAVHDAAATLAAIYRQAFVPYVVCNPLQARGAPVANPAFVRMVDKTVAEVALG